MTYLATKEKIFAENILAPITAPIDLTLLQQLTNMTGSGSSIYSLAPVYLVMWSVKNKMSLGDVQGDVLYVI